MQIYVKRGIQGRIAGASDNFTSKIANADWSYISEGSATLSPQWEPEKLESRSTRKVLGGTVEAESLAKDGTITRVSDRQTQQADDKDAAGADYRKYDYSQ